MGLEKRTAKKFEHLGRVAGTAPQEIQQRRTAAEDVYTGVLGRLGAPGTYEDRPTEGPNLLGGDEGASTQPESAFKEEELLGSYRGLPGVKTRTLDKEKYLKDIEGTSQFRTMSRLQAESEQLIAREGPLYDEMIKNIQLPIIEGNAAIARENAEQLKRMAGRGGSGRRTAMEAVQRIRAQERLNSQKVQQLSQSRFALDQWARENARTTLEFGQNWASNLGGVRESYQSAMDGATDLLVTKSLPIMVNTTQKAAEWRAAAEAEKKAKVGRWISGVIGVASLALGGAGAMIGQGLLGAGGAAGALGRVAATAEPYAGALAQTGMEQLGLGLGR